MLNKANGKSCGLDDVIVSYIYDEITTSERHKFETHLVDCSSCTEEFTAISGARFSIFEWQKVDFSELATPEIVIPRIEGRRAKTERSGLLAGLRSMFGGYGIPISAAAAVLVFLGLGLAVFTSMGEVGEYAEITVVENMPEVPQNVAAGKPLATETVIRQGDTVVSDTLSVKKTVPVSGQNKPAKKLTGAGRSKPASQLTAEVKHRTKPRPQTTKAPMLSNFDEADDKSLRLTDLFDDGIGSIR